MGDCYGDLSLIASSSLATDHLLVADGVLYQIYCSEKRLTFNPARNSFAGEEIEPRLTYAICSTPVTSSLDQS